MFELTCDGERVSWCAYFHAVILELPEKLFDLGLSMT